MALAAFGVLGAGVRTQRTAITIGYPDGQVVFVAYFDFHNARLLYDELTRRWVECHSVLYFGPPQLPKPADHFPNRPENASDGDLDPVGVGESAPSKLDRLDALLESGQLTPDEYKVLKQRALGFSERRRLIDPSRFERLREPDR